MYCCSIFRKTRTIFIEQPLVGPLTLDTNECKSSLTLYISFENSHDDDDAEPDADDDDDDAE